jgi:hypothetical protein
MRFSVNNFAWRLVPASLILCCAAALGQAQSTSPQAPADQSSASGTVVTRNAPPLPKVPVIRRSGEQGMWIGVNYWSATPGTVVNRGTSPFDYPGYVKMPGKPKLNQSVDLGFAVGDHNALKVSYLRSSAHGSVHPGHAVNLWSVYYDPAYDLDTNYLMTGLKFSFEYLTWPYPVKDSRFRLKTLWQMHYVSMRTGFDAPTAPLTDSDGNYLLNSQGDLLSYAAHGTTNVVLPAVGLGFQEYVTDKFRLEGGISGFAFPHRSNLWDAEASASIRLSAFDLRFGWRGYQARSSPKGVFWTEYKMRGPFVGITYHID